MTLLSEQEQTTPKSQKLVNKAHLVRRPALSTSKVPSNYYNYNYMDTTQSNKIKLVNSSECLLKQADTKSNPNNISSSISSSIISHSTTTSGFVSGSNSISSSKSNDFLKNNENLINNKNYYSNHHQARYKSGSVSSTRSIYETKLLPQQAFNTKTRITSYQPGLISSTTTATTTRNLKSPNVKKLSDIQASNNSLSNYCDPISSSSRHTSTNSNKLLNQILITPRNSTSTVLIESEKPSEKRLSYVNKSQKYNQDEDEDLINDLEDGLNYDEDDDIFDYNENQNELVNKQYHNSLSTASCIANEINYLNMYNITPDTSTSASSSSFSSGSGNKLNSPKQISPELIKPKPPNSASITITNNNSNNINRQLKNSSSPLVPPLPYTTTQSFLNQTNQQQIDLIKNFTHFDIQSIFFNYSNLKSLISCLYNSMNYKTGASAASRQSSLENLNRTLPPIQPRLPNQTQLNTVSRSRLSSSLYENNPSPSKVQKPSFNLSSNDPDVFQTELKNELVEECQCFRLEVGGDVFKGLGLVQDVSQRRMMKLNSINILDKINLNYKKEIIDLIESNNNEPFTIEYQDWGAYYYRYFFSSLEHSNYLGLDRDIGPVAISIRREKLLIDPNSRSNSSNCGSSSAPNERGYDYAYRFIMRTSDLNTLRGTILEEHVTTNSSLTSKGLPHKDVISNLMPDLNLNSLRLAESKIVDKLIELDEQYLIKNHKIGILLCKAGQSTEEEMYNNKDSTPAFEEFLQLLGEKVCLKGFQSYRGGLDNQNDTTGTNSVYTKFRNKEIMFHVSTLLPYSANDRQQLTRKRHIGNDLVTIVFQEPGSLPFSPKTIRSQYQHIFIIVRAMNPNSFNTQYSVAVSYSKDIPAFGPPLPKNPLFLKSKEFRDFLLAKIVNADNVGLKCEKFTQIRMRTRNGTLKDLVDQYSTKFTLENSSNSNIGHKLALFNFGSIKQKKLRSKSLQAFNNNSLNSSLNSSEDYNILCSSLSKLTGCLFWNIELIEDFQYIIKNCCLLGISKQNIVVVDAHQKCVLYSIGCNAVIGWSIYEAENSFVLYFDLGECINIRLKTKTDLYMVIRRLECFTKGCKTIELSLEKKDCGPLGFNIHHDGVVTEVEPYSLAYYRGLKQGTRIVKIGDYYVINLNHDKMIDLLRNSTCLKVTFIMPFEDGTARRGQDDSFSLYAYLSTCSSLNERQIDSIKTTPIFTNLQKFNRNQLPSLCMFSPQKNRRLTTSSNKSKLAFNRLSISENNEIDLKEANEIITNSNENKAYPYYGVNNNKKVNESDNLIESVQSPKKIFTNNSFEWTKMVQTASKAFENAHRNSENYFNFNESTSCSKSSSNSNKNKIDLKECIEHNLEKNASYDELKEKLLHLQLELNKEKQEKNIIVKQEAHIREEYLNLKQEYLKMKEKMKTKEPSTPKNRKYSVKNEFIDCGNEIKANKATTTPQVLRLNNDSFFPNNTYSITNDSQI